MKHFVENIQNAGGAGIAGASVTVFFTGTQNQPTIYSDDGITPKANPVITDALGRFDFYVADGRYDLAISGPTIIPFSISNIEIADLTEAQTADAIWDTEAIRFVNQGIIPSTPPTGNVNIYTKAVDKRLYYKDDTGTEIGPLVPGGTTSPVNAPSPFVFNTDMEFKGPNPWVDIRNFGARAVNPFSTPAAPGITANCIGTQSIVNISSASTFQNGDGVILYGCGPAHSMSTPSAPTVTPSLALAGTGTGINIPSASGSTTYNYSILARDRNGGLTAASPIASTSVGNVLGSILVNITSMTRSGRTVTVTTAGAHLFSPGCSNGACGEVYIGSANGLSEASFYGWYQVLAAPDSSHFTFQSAADTALGAATSATGGTATAFSCNKVSWASVAGAIQYYIYSDRANPGTFALVGVSDPDSPTGVNPSQLQWEDYGSPMMDNFVFPSFIPNTPPGAPTSDHLSTTILSGAGSTTLTLANAAGTTVSGATIRLDAAPGIKAAAASISNRNGTLYIPATGSNSEFVVNSWLQLNGGSFSIGQSGNLFLNDTVEVTIAGGNGNGGVKWIGDITPQYGSGPSNSAWSSAPGIGVNSAHPGLFFSNNGGGQAALHVSHLAIGAQPLNGSKLVMTEPAFNQTFDWIDFGSGSGVQDYMSMALHMRSLAGGDSSNVTLDYVGFTPGGVGNGVSHTPTVYCPSVGNVIIPHSYSVHRGMLINSQAFTQLGLGGVAYINGGGTPLLTTSTPQAPGHGVSGSVLVGSVVLDTISHPCVATLGVGATVQFLNGPCSPSFIGPGFAPAVTGNPVAVNGAASLTTFLSNGPLASPTGTGGVNFNQNVLTGGGYVGPNQSFFVRQNPPTAPTCSVSAGGSIPVGSYQFQMGYVWQNNTGAAGTPGQNGDNPGAASGICTTTGGNQTITVNFPSAPAGLKGWILYTNGVGSQAPPDIPNTVPMFPASTTSVVISHAFGAFLGPPQGIAFTGGPTMLMPGTQGIVSGGPVILGGTIFASLGTPGNGQITYCADCTIANPCAGGGTGALAKRLNSIWVCN